MSLFFVLVLAGCGYKPASKLARLSLGDSVYISVEIDKKEPQNSVWLTDAIRSGLASRLNVAISDDINAPASINVRIAGIGYEPIAYDAFGYITAYRVRLELEFKTKTKQGLELCLSADESGFCEFASLISAEQDFSLAGGLKDIELIQSVLSQEQRFKAVQLASAEAFDEYISLLVLKSLKGK